jgi:Domain of unknown function (DUF4062)
MSLLIDGASAARQLDENEFRAWCDGRGVFISSVMDELAAERRALAEALRGLGLRPVLFEDLGGRDETAQRAYLAGVAQADIYVGIIAERYGTMQPSGRSPTHEEYREAGGLGRRISVWSREPSAQRQGDARDFLSEVQVFHTTGRFGDSADLVAGVEARLREIAADDEAPWVKIGSAIVRADRIRDDGSMVTLGTTVRDASVARYLEGLRPDQWARSEGVALTTADLSRPVRIENITSETRARSARSIEVEARIDQGGQAGSMGIGMASYSAEELAAIGFESGLLRTPLPSELQGPTYGISLDVSDPLQELMSHNLPEDAIAGIAVLLIVERLVGASFASHVDRFEMGPENAGRRRIRVAYTEAPRYVNQAPVSRVVEGVRPWQS